MPNRTNAGINNNLKNMQLKIKIRRRAGRPRYDENSNRQQECLL